MTRNRTATRKSMITGLPFNPNIPCAQCDSHSCVPGTRYCVHCVDAGDTSKPINVTTGLSTRSYFYATPYSGLFVKVWYDRSLRLWTSYTVDAPNDDGHQISSAQYDTSSAPLPLVHYF